MIDINIKGGGQCHSTYLYKGDLLMRSHGTAVCNRRVPSEGNSIHMHDDAPVYMTMFITPTTSDSGIYKMDLSGLQ